MSTASFCKVKAPFIGQSTILLFRIWTNDLLKVDTYQLVFIGVRRVIVTCSSIGRLLGIFGIDLLVSFKRGLTVVFWYWDWEIFACALFLFVNWTYYVTFKIYDPVIWVYCWQWDSVRLCINVKVWLNFFTIFVLNLF